MLHYVTLVGLIAGSLTVATAFPQLYAGRYSPPILRMLAKLVVTDEPQLERRRQFVGLLALFIGIVGLVLLMLGYDTVT